VRSASKQRRIVMLTALGAVLTAAPGVAACGGGSDNSSVDSNAKTVEAVDFGFEAPDLSVKSGETVTWTNTGGQIHNVMGRGFSSDAIAPGETYKHRFDAPGRYRYLCTLHPTTMRGVISVVPKEKQ
jgi:plastocyanin